MLSKKGIQALSLVVLMGAPTLAFAQVEAGVSTKIETPAVRAEVNVKMGAREEEAKQRAVQEMRRRTEALNGLSARINSMVRVSPEFKQNLSVAVQTQISTFAQLQNKIESGADVATLKTDIQSISQSHRFFSLLMQQVRISAAADRIVNITTMFSSVGTKLQTRIAVAAQAGADTASMSETLNSIATKISNAQNKAQAAVSAVVALQPDQGDKTLAAANQKVIVQANADIRAAHKDLESARADISTILKSLKKISVGATSTTSVQ